MTSPLCDDCRSREDVCTRDNGAKRCNACELKHVEANTLQASDNISAASDGQHSRSRSQTNAGSDSEVASGHDDGSNQLSQWQDSQDLFPSQTSSHVLSLDSTLSQNVPPTPSHQSPAASSSMNSTPDICIAGCTCTDARRGIVKCLWCRRPYHKKCISADVYICDKCRVVPEQVTSISQSVMLLSTSLQTLIDTNARLEETIATQNSTIMGLQNRISELASKQQCIHAPDNRKDLVIGSSVIRDIDADKIENTDISCIRGGKIRDIHEQLKANTKDYKSISIVVGGNDCDSKSGTTPTEELMSQYSAMVADARLQCPDVRLVTVLPRDVGTDTTDRIDALNAGIVELSNNEGLILINNDETFKLKDGSVNDGYYTGDGVHLNKAGSNRLAKNLGTKPKPEHAKDITRSYKGALARGKTNPRSSRGAPGTTPSSAGPRKKPPTTNSTPPANARPHNVNPQRTGQNGDHNQWQTVSNRRRSPQHTGHSEQYRDGGKCEFCSEKNHRKDSCRHGHPILCNVCRRYGHKAKHHSE